MAFVFDPLAAFEKAAAARRQADAHYRFTLLRAFVELERTSDPFPYATLAKAAGITRQSARVMVERALANRRAASQSPGYGYDLLAEH